jgi:hypothetical protein
VDLFEHLVGQFVDSVCIVCLFTVALGVMAVQNYEPDEERDTRSIRSGLSRNSSVVLKQNKENQEQVRRPLGVRMGTRAVFESRESLVTAEMTAPNSPEPTIPEAYIISEFYLFIC